MIETTETFLKIEAVFHEVLSHERLDKQGASVLVAKLCYGDEGMIAEVQSLLEASEEEERESVVRGREPQVGGADGAERKRIGPYEIDRLLGRGGMGAVYLAHRVDGQFDQQVAIKLIDLPLATDVFRERFRQERQILAGLNHPYIARLFDGGVTPSGDLYLAMEYVDGVAISRYCNEHNLSIDQRLMLFEKVCEAVQFAHQNLVVHRDLKPDNILVAPDGSPRLLDFGTAKLLSPSIEKPGQDFTRQGFQSYTPQYASPEQILGNPITTASDTYSLGMLLYLLMTGTMPYELKELTTAEMVRVVCEEPPRRPGNAVGSSKHLDADLEAIVLKAIRKEAQQRYLTAEQFSTDIQDYLAGRPVAARRGTVRYRVAKFIRRHRWGIAAAVVLALTLATGVVGVLWQARIANQERRKADARSADLRELSNSLLSELDEAIKQLPGSTGVQKLLVTRVLDHLDRMAQDAEGDAATQLDLVDAYTRLADLQGDPYDQNLGDPAGALVSIGKALAIAKPVADTHPNDAAALHSLAIAQVTRSEILFGTGKTREAVQSMQGAVAAYEHLIADPKATATLVAEAAAFYGSLGDELGQTGTASLADPKAARAAYQRTIDLDHRALAMDPNLLRPRRGLAIMEMKLGSIEMYSDPAQALQEFQSALILADALPKAEKSSYSFQRMRAMILRKEANAFSELGQYDQAQPVYDQVVKISREFVAKDSQDLRALTDLQVILDDQAVSFENAANPVLASPTNNMGADRLRNLAAAEKLYAQFASIFETILKKDPTNESWKVNHASAEVHLGTLQQQLHMPGDSADTSRKGFTTLREMAGSPEASPYVLDQATSAAIMIEPQELRDPAFAVQIAERGVAISHRKTASWLLSLAQAYRADGQTAKSVATAQEGLRLLPPLKPGTLKPRMRKLFEAVAQ